MVLTRAGKMDSEKGSKIKVKIPNRNGGKYSGNERSRMKSDSKSSSNCSNPESEEDDQSMPATVTKPVGLPGSSIKVTLKKTRSCSSTSSRESAQSFEVVRRVLPITEEEYVSGEEDCENPKAQAQEKEKTPLKSPSVDAGENEKESEEEPQNANSSDDSDIEILSDDSQESFTERPSPAVSVKAENIPINTVVELKTEQVPQSSIAIKKEEFKVKVKSLKQELLREEPDEIVVLKDDDESDNTQENQPQNEVEKKEIKEQVKEHKFKVNVRSFDDLIDPRSSANLINMPPPGPIDQTPIFLTQNGASFPPPYLTCDVCGVQFDSPELLNSHKVTMKHFKCSFKECELVVMSNQQEFLDHQRLIHNVMPSPVQQLAHQVQRLPAMSFDQQLQSGVPPLPDSLSPGMFTQSLQMTNQQVPIQRNMRPMMRASMPHNMISTRGRNIQRGSIRGRSASLNMAPRGSSLKRPLNAPRRGAPPMKRTSIDRNPYPSTLNKNPHIAKSITESLSKAITKNTSTPATQQDVVNLFSKRGLTISTVDNGNHLTLPPGLSLNSAVSIIPTSPHKVPNTASNRVSSSVSNHESNTVSKHLPTKVTNQSMDTVDLTGPDKPKKYWPCDVCSKTYQNLDKMYEHITAVHKSVSFSQKCNLCPFSCPSVEILQRHKTANHKSETSNMPLVMPILDLSKTINIHKLRAMGVTNYLPVAQLDNQGGQFGVPIMSVANPGTLEGLKYTNFFNLGTVRKF